MNSSILSGTSGSVIVLLGAGASVNAGVPHTQKMIADINDMLNKDWEKYKPIYEHLKKLFGKESRNNDREIVYDDLNIEKLFSQLDELLALLDGKHNLYPFFKNWIDLFKNLYGFQDVKNFRFSDSFCGISKI
jgi:NAD-dependent SIR2 family protein deacetylase